METPTAAHWVHPRPSPESGDGCQVVGRDRQIDLIRRLLVEANGGHRSVVVLGEAGSGKTSVVEWALSALPHRVVCLSTGQEVDLDSLEEGATPTVLVVEDADRVEPGLLDSLAARATGQVPFTVPIVFTARPDGRAARLLADLPAVVLEKLDSRAAREILARHATSPIAAAVAERLIEATGANPQALRHLASSLSADELTGQRPLPYPPHIGTRLMDSLVSRVRALGTESRLAMLLAAAGGDTPDVIAAAIGMIGPVPEGTGPPADEATAATEGPDARLGGPLLSCVLYHSATLEERRRAHGALAAACMAAGHLEAEAWHLLRSEEAPRPTAADRVQAAAELALSQRRLAVAAELYAGAGGLSSPAALRDDRMLSSATAWMAVGRTETAARTVDEILGSGPSLHLGSRAGWLRGRALLVSGLELEGRRYLMDQASATAGANPGWAVRMAAAASASALRSGRFEEASSSAAAALSWSGTADDLARAMAGLVADSARLAGGDQRGVQTLVSGLEEACRSETLLFEDPMTAVIAPLAMVWSENHEAARRVLDRFETAARQANAYGALAPVLTTIALLQHRLCEPYAAAVAAHEASDLAIMTAQPTVVTLATAVLAIAEAILGRSERCRIRCTRILEQGSAPPAIRASALGALGLLELGDGRPAQAIRWLEVLAVTPDSAARSDPGFMMWRADLIDAYRRADDPERARAVLAELERSGISGGGQGRVGAAVKRCRAALCDDEQAESLYRDALRFYVGRRWRFARARTQMDLGEHLHRKGDRSGSEAALREALSLFGEIGAAGWERQALGALDRCGLLSGTPTSPSLPLTPLEHQVAMSASLGATPVEISSALAVPEQEVADHLTSALEKLGATATRLPELAAELASLVPTGDAPGRPVSPSATAGTLAGTPGRIRLLGDFEIEAVGAEDSRPTGSVGLAVKIVALAGRMPAEELIDELWPEAGSDAGRNRLRTLLSRVRQRCGPVLVRTGDRIGLAPGIETDARLFEAAVLGALAARGADDHRWGQMARDALALYRGELLPGDREVLRAVGLRERLRRRHLEVLYLVAHDSAANGQVDQAVGLLEDAIAENRHDEGPYVRAASVLQGAGRVVEALSFLRRARAALAEIGLTLSPVGQKVEDTLLSGHHRPD